MNPFKRRGISMFKRILCIVIINCFLVSNISFAATDFSAKRNLEETERSALAVDTLAIPRDFGTIKERCAGTDSRFVLYIQDAHCNYEAQTNIARILEYLIKHYKVNFVAVEGADGVVDTSWFKAFPDNDIKQEVADYFMKKGEITGAEFLSITSDYPFTIYGAEDRKYYVKNLNTFLESYPYREDFLKYYTSLKGGLHNLKKYIYTKELRDLDAQITAHNEKEIKFADYVRYLDELANSKNVDTRTYTNFAILLRALTFEKDIDFDTVNDERAVIIDDLSKKLAKDELSDLVNKSLSFKLGKIDGNAFYAYLAKLAEENDIDIPKKYKNLALYIKYTKIYSKIDNELLFDEIDELVGVIKEQMFKNDDQRALDRLWKNVTIVLGFMKIELTNKEYEYYERNKDKFTPESFVSFIDKQSTRYGLSYSIEVPDPQLNHIFGRLIDFYEIALKRDKILVDNMFKGMRGKKTEVAVLITGGFHTKGVTKFLKEKETPFVVISPSITEDVESPYISVLTGQKTPFEELLTKAEEVGELGTPYITDPNILNRLERIAHGGPAQQLAEDIVRRRDLFFEEFAVLYTMTCIGVVSPSRRVTRSDVVERFRRDVQGDDLNIQRVIRALESQDIFDHAARLVSDAGGNGVQAIEAYLGRLAPRAEVEEDATRGTYRGLALTITGEELDRRTEDGVHKAIRDFFTRGPEETEDAYKRRLKEARQSRPSIGGLTFDGVDIYEVPQLENFDNILIAHLGYGGQATGHTKRQIYLSTKKLALVKSLSREAQRQFWAHEIAHLDNPRLSEKDLQVQYPINMILAETAVLADDSVLQDKTKTSIGEKTLFLSGGGGGEEFVLLQAIVEYRGSRRITPDPRTIRQIQALQGEVESVLQGELEVEGLHPIGELRTVADLIAFMIANPERTGERLDEDVIKTIFEGLFFAVYQNNQENVEEVKTVFRELFKIDQIRDIMPITILELLSEAIDKGTSYETWGSYTSLRERVLNRGRGRSRSIETLGQLLNDENLENGFVHISSESQSALMGLMIELAPQYVVLRMITAPPLARRAEERLKEIEVIEDQASLSVARIRQLIDNNYITLNDLIMNATGEEGEANLPRMQAPGEMHFDEFLHSIIAAQTRLKKAKSAVRRFLAYNIKLFDVRRVKDVGVIPSDLAGQYEHDNARLRAKYEGLVDPESIVASLEHPTQRRSDMAGFLGIIGQFIARVVKGEMTLKQFKDAVVLVVTDGGSRTQFAYKVLSEGYAGLLPLPGQRVSNTRELAALTLMATMEYLPDGPTRFVGWSASDNFAALGDAHIGTTSLNDKEALTEKLKDAAVVKGGVKVRLFDGKTADIIKDVKLPEVKRPADISDDDYKKKQEEAGLKAIRQALVKGLASAPAADAMLKQMLDTIAREKLVELGALAVDEEGKMTAFMEKEENRAALILAYAEHGGELSKNPFLELVDKDFALLLQKKLKAIPAVTEGVGNLDELHASYMKSAHQSRFVNPEKWMEIDHKVADEDWAKIKEVMDETRTELRESTGKSEVYVIDYGEGNEWIDLTSLDAYNRFLDMVIQEDKVRRLLGLPTTETNIVEETFYKDSAVQLLFRDGEGEERPPQPGDKFLIESSIIKGRGTLIIEEGAMISSSIIEIPAGKTVVVRSGAKIINSHLRDVEIRYYNEGPVVINSYFSDEYDAEYLDTYGDEWVGSVVVDGQPRIGRNIISALFQGNTIADLVEVREDLTTKQQRALKDLAALHPLYLGQYVNVEGITWDIDTVLLDLIEQNLESGVDQRYSFNDAKTIDYPILGEPRKEELRAGLRVEIEKVLKGSPLAAFQAYLSPETAGDYYSENLIKGDVEGAEDIKKAVTGETEKVTVAFTDAATGEETELTVNVDKGIRDSLEQYDIDLKTVLEKAITLRGIENFVGIEKEQTLVLLDKSKSLFEDHRRNGFIGINKILFEVIAQEVPQEALEVILGVGLTHEFRHEAGVGNSEDEELALTTEDTKLTGQLATWIAREREGTREKGIEEAALVQGIIESVSKVTGVSLYIEKLTESPVTSLVEGRHVRGEYDFKQEVPYEEQGFDLDAEKLNPGRNEAIREAFTKAAAAGTKRVSIDAALSAIDGPGASLGLPKFQQILTELGLDIRLDEVPSTPTIASIFRGKIFFELLDDEDAIEYVAPDFDHPDQANHPGKMTEDNPYRHTGEITPVHQGHAAPYIFQNIFGLKGIRIIVKELHPIVRAGGMGSSNVANIGLIAAASILSGANLSQADIFNLAVKIENDEFGNLGGGERQLTALLGGAYQHVWLSSIAATQGQYVNPYSAFSMPFLDDEQLEGFSKRVLLVQAGKEFDEIGQPVVSRTAPSINNMWTDLLVDGDEVGFALHRGKLALAALYAKALKQGDYVTARKQVEEYVKVRDQLSKRWINLALDARKVVEVRAEADGLSVEAFRGTEAYTGLLENGTPALPWNAFKYEKLMFDRNDERHRFYDAILDMYRTLGDDGLRAVSVYSLDPIATLIRDGLEEGFAFFPLSAGGPEANLYVITADDDTTGVEAFLNKRGINEFDSANGMSSEEARAIMNGQPVGAEDVTGIRIVRGWLRLIPEKGVTDEERAKALQPITFEGFEALRDAGLDLELPAAPNRILSSQLVGDREGPIAEKAEDRKARYLSYRTIQNAQDVVRRVEEAKAGVSPDEVLPLIEPAVYKAGESKLEHLGVVDGYVIGRYSFVMGGTLPADKLAEGKTHRLYVEEGEVKITDEKGQDVTLTAGDVIEWDAARYTIHAPSGDATVYVEFQAGLDDGDIYAGYEAMRLPEVQTRLGEALDETNDRLPVMLHVPLSMYHGDEFAEEKKLLSQVSGGAVVMNFYEVDIDPETGEVRDIEKLKKEQESLAEADAQKYEHVFLLYDKLLEHVQRDPEAYKALETLLGHKRLPVRLPKPGKHIAMIRELEATAVTIGLTSEDDLDEGEGNPMAINLRNIMSQIVGAAEPLSFDRLKALLQKAVSYEQFNPILAILVEYLMPMEKYDMDQRIHERRQLLWAA